MELVFEGQSAIKFHLVDFGHKFYSFAPVWDMENWLLYKNGTFYRFKEILYSEAMIKRENLEPVQ